MEQDCIVGLYHSLGVSIGAEFSSEDVSALFRKVFHVHSTTDEAHMAMKKIAGKDDGWSCVGENVLDVLLEMEKERERTEKLYWDLQLLNMGSLDSLYRMDTQVMINAFVPSCPHPRKDSNPIHKSHNQADSGSTQLCTIDTTCSQRSRAERRAQQKTETGMWRLKKAARHRWARLVAEGVQSIVPTPWQDQRLGVRGQAWGCVSLSDVLLLVEVKYDVVTHKLYTEMLQEHHSLTVWETLLPWQRDKKEEELGDLVEEALESGDLLCLAELPGAFRIYRAREDASFKSCPGFRALSWSAISVLYELHTARQQEKDTLTVLSERLDREMLRLLCLYVRLATLRARREKLSYAALLAAQQSWETWPRVSSPCKAEHAALWLQSEEEEELEDFISVSPQQELLQLLVLSQEQERKYLLKLIQGVFLEDLQESGDIVSQREEGEQRQTALREGCKRRLEQIHASLQRHTETQTSSEQTPPQLQPPSHLQIQQIHESPQPQIQSCTNIDNTQAFWSQNQLGNCAQILLTHLTELQEVQASVLLPDLLDKNPQQLRALRDEYESKLQERHISSLMQLLTSDAPLTSGSQLISNSSLSPNGSSEQTTAQYSYTGPAEDPNGAGPHKAPNNSMVDSVGGPSQEPNGVQTVYVAEKQDICTGCGAVMEDLPYLEILCGSDPTSTSYEDLSAEGGAQQEEEGGRTMSPQSNEKQGSLITLAWSKPQEDTNYQTEPEDRSSAQNRDVQSSLKSKDGPSDVPSTDEDTHCRETAGESHREMSKVSSFQLGEQQCSTGQQKESLTVEERPITDQRERAETRSECDLPGLCTETANVCREGTEVELCPTRTESELWDLRGPELEDRECTSQATTDSSFSEREAMESTVMEREQRRESVSVMERERTMRNLVDMQRKVEERHQRDRERQLLRVQERLSIIQNRKADEDLLGLNHTDRLRHLTHDLPQEDKNQQKTVVRERLEQLRRERSCIMQSRRDRNTAGFKELLGPVTLATKETEDEAD